MSTSVLFICWKFPCILRRINSSLDSDKEQKQAMHEWREKCDNIGKWMDSIEDKVELLENRKPSDDLMTLKYQIEECDVSFLPWLFPQMDAAATWLLRFVLCPLYGSFIKELKMLGRRRRLKRDIKFSIYKRSYDELTTVFDIWSLFKDFNNALLLLKSIAVSMLKSILSNSSRLSASLRRPEDVKMLRLALYTERGRCWDYTLGTENYQFIPRLTTAPYILRYFFHTFHFPLFCFCFFPSHRNYKIIFRRTNCPVQCSHWEKKSCLDWAWSLIRRPKSEGKLREWKLKWKRYRRGPVPRSKGKNYK